jgi:hypothetical protein
MAGIVDVVIPVEAEAAAALTDTRNREAIGRIVSRILLPRPDQDFFSPAPIGAFHRCQSSSGTS